jgi:hypothetical protein
LDEKLKKFDSPEMAEELKKQREKEREDRRYEGFKLGARYLTGAYTIKIFTAVIYGFLQ